MKLTPRVFAGYRIEMKEVTLITVKYNDIKYNDITETHEFDDFDEFVMKTCEKVEVIDLRKKIKSPILVSKLKENEYIVIKDEVHLVMHKMDI